MSVGIFYPAVSGDDGFRNTGAEGFNASQVYLVLGEWGGNGATDFFVRFPNITIPQGATITSAFVRLTCWEPSVTTVVRSNIYFNDVDDAVAPTDGAEYDALGLTGAIAWDGLGEWVLDTEYDTVDVSSILQTIVNRPGWASGQAVMAILQNNGSDSGAHRISDSYDETGDQYAELHVEWTGAITAEPFSLTATLSANPSILLETQPFEITSSLSISDIYSGAFVEAEPLQLTSSLSANLSAQIVSLPFELIAELSANISNQIVASALQLIGSLDANVSLGHFVIAEPLSLEAVLSANLSTQIVAQAFQLISELSARPVIVLRDDMKYYLDIENLPIVTDALRLLQRILKDTDGKTTSDFIFDRTHGIP